MAAGAAAKEQKADFGGMWAVVGCGLGFPEKRKL